MAAATNKPGPVHYALIFFVFVSVVLGIVSYMYFRESSDKIAAMTKLEEENKNANKSFRNSEDSIQALKVSIGTKLDMVDDPNNPQNKATVVQAVRDEIGASGKDQAGTNVLETLRKMRDALDAASADRDAKGVKIAALEKEILALKSLYQQQVDNHGATASKAERTKLETIADREEKVNAKIEEVARVKAERNAAHDELLQENDSFMKILNIILNLSCH